MSHVTNVHIHSENRQYMQHIWVMDDESGESMELHTITRFSIKTAGLAFGGTGLFSYRVRGVGGSCAEHFNCRILYDRHLPTVILLLLVFHHPLTLSL